MVKIAYGQDGALVADKVYRILGADGRYLRSFFGGLPDWCHLASSASRYDAVTAADRLRKLHALSIQAGAVAC